MEVEKKFIRLSGLLILSLFCLGIRESWGDAVSRHRFYDTYRKMRAEKELDWRVRTNKAENLRLKFEATHEKFNSRKENYINYLNTTEKDYKSLLRKEEKLLSAPYLSFEDRRDISKSYQRQTKEVTDYYGKLRRNYYDYVKKSALIRIVSFPVQVGITLATAGQALPVLLPLQTAKFAYDEYVFSKHPLEGTLTQRVIDKLYGFGTCFYTAFNTYEHAHVLSTGKNLSGEVVSNTTFPTLARLEYFRAGYAASTPFIQTVSEYSPNSFLARASPYMSMANSAISIGMEMSKPYQFAKEFGNSPKNGAKYFNNFTPSIYSLTSNTLNITQNIGRIAGGRKWSNSGTAFWINQGTSLGSAIADAHVRHYKKTNVDYINKRADIYKENFDYRAEVMNDPQFGDFCGKFKDGLKEPKINSPYLSKRERAIKRENHWGSAYYKLTQAEVLRREGVIIREIDYSPAVSSLSPNLSNIYSGHVAIEGKHSATARIYYLKGEKTLPYASFNINGKKGSWVVPEKIDYLANRYQDVHMKNEGKFSIKVYFPEELIGTESKPHIYYGNDEKDSFIMDMQDRRYNRDWMKTKDSGISYASLGQDRFLLSGSNGAMTAINTRLNSGNKYDYFIQIAKSHTLTQGSDFKVLTDGKAYQNPLVKELNQPREQFFENFGNPFLWRQNETLLQRQYGTSYGSQEKELLSQITFQATPQNLARRYDPYLQHYTLRNQDVEQTQDALGRYQTVNRLKEKVELLGRDYITGGPGYAKPETVRGGNRLGEVYERRLGREELRVVDLRRDYAVVMRPGDNRTRNILNDNYALYQGEYREGNWEKVKEYNVKENIGKRERFFERSQRHFTRANRNTDIFKRDNILAKRMVLADVINYNKSIQNLDKTIGRQSRVIEGRKEEQDIVRGLDFSNNPNRNIYPSLTSEAIKKEGRIKDVYLKDRENVLGIRDGSRAIVGEVTGITYREDIWKHKTKIASESTKLTDALRELRESKYIDSREYDFLGMNLRKNIEDIGFSRSAIPQKIMLFQTGNITDRGVITTLDRMGLHHPQSWGYMRDEFVNNRVPGAKYFSLLQLPSAAAQFIGKKLLISGGEKFFLWRAIKSGKAIRGGNFYMVNNFNNFSKWMKAANHVTRFAKLYNTITFVPTVFYTAADATTFIESWYKAYNFEQTQYLQRQE